MIGHAKSYKQLFKIVFRAISQIFHLREYLFSYLMQCEFEFNVHSYNICHFLCYWTSIRGNLHIHFVVNGHISLKSANKIWYWTQRVPIYAFKKIKYSFLSTPPVIRDLKRINKAMTSFLYCVRNVVSRILNILHMLLDCIFEQHSWSKKVFRVFRLPQKSSVK